jgi:hypothetical protein
MKIKLIYLILLLFVVFACTKEEKLIVKDFKDNDFNILESKKEKIIIITNERVCHDCIMNLDSYISNNYNLKKFGYYLLTQDMKNTPFRRISFETYKNIYTPNIQKILFTEENPNIQKSLHIPKNLFKQSTPYVIYIDKYKKAHYYSHKVIFDARGYIDESFRLK